MLTDAIKWLSLAQTVLNFIRPILDSQLRSKGEAPEWMDDVFELMDQVTANARAGVAFDEALARRIKSRLSALPEKPAKKDFETLGQNVRAAYADFKAVMAERRAR